MYHTNIASEAFTLLPHLQTEWLLHMNMYFQCIQTDNIRGDCAAKATATVMSGPRPLSKRAAGEISEVPLQAALQAYSTWVLPQTSRVPVTYEQSTVVIWPNFVPDPCYPTTHSNERTLSPLSGTALVSAPFPFSSGCAGVHFSPTRQ